MLTANWSTPNDGMAPEPIARTPSINVPLPSERVPRTDIPWRDSMIAELVDVNAPTPRRPLLIMDLPEIICSFFSSWMTLFDALVVITTAVIELVIFTFNCSFKPAVSVKPVVFWVENPSFDISTV